MKPRFYLAGLLLLAGCLGPQPAEPPVTAVAVPAGDMSISSPAFSADEMIPVRFTCDGENVSPPLQWTAVPAAAKTLALIADDPDAPLGTWIHWVVFNLPASAKELPEGVTAEDPLPGAGVQGISSFRQTGYGGPCPPSGTHRYYFRLYALDTTLHLKGDALAGEVQAAMEGHVVAEAVLMGRYGR